MTTMRRARPLFMYSATDSMERSFRVCVGVSSSTRGADWSCPILKFRPWCLPLPLLRPFSESRHGLLWLSCWRWALCLRPILKIQEVRLVQPGYLWEVGSSWRETIGGLRIAYGAYGYDPTKVGCTKKCQGADVIMPRRCCPEQE